MNSRTSILPIVLVVSSLLIGCSSDDGKPTSGPGTGSGTGGGTNGGKTPAPAMDTSPTSPATGTKKAALEGCVKDDDCTSSVCYIGDQGSYCSVKCTPDNVTTACVAPFAGTCNKKGFCKKP